MKYYDITREMMSAPLYPGTPEPYLEEQASIRKGDPCNLKMLHSCLHAGTHSDAYNHFDDGSCDMADMPLGHYIGPCYVLSVPGHSTIEAAFFKANLPQGVKRLLLKSNGTAYLAPCAGRYLIEREIITVGTDAWSVAPGDDETTVHTLLLSNGIAIIESLDLRAIADGEYFLAAAPLKIEGADGAPCRAILFEGCPVE